MDNILGLFEKLESQSLAVQPSGAWWCAIATLPAVAAPRRVLRVPSAWKVTIWPWPRSTASGAAPAPPCVLRRRWSRRSPTTRSFCARPWRPCRPTTARRLIMDAAMQAVAEGKYDPAKVVVVKSLGRVDESLIAVLAAGGTTSVALVAGPVEGAVAGAGSGEGTTAEGNAEATEAAEIAETGGRCA